MTKSFSTANITPFFYGHAQYRHIHPAELGK